MSSLLCYQPMNKKHDGIKVNNLLRLPLHCEQQNNTKRILQKAKGQIIRCKSVSQKHTNFIQSHFFCANKETAFMLLQMEKLTRMNL